MSMQKKSARTAYTVTDGEKENFKQCYYSIVERICQV